MNHGNFILRGKKWTQMLYAVLSPFNKIYRISKSIKIENKVDWWWGKLGKGKWLMRYFSKAAFATFYVPAWKHKHGKHV